MLTPVKISHANHSTAEALVLKSMKPGPAQNSRECEAQEHGVQQDKSTDRSIGVLAQDHECHKPYSRSLQVQLAGSVVGQRDSDSAKERVERSHEGIVELFWIFLSRLEFKRAIVSSEVAGQANEHLPKGWMHIEIELAFEVV